ncbi:Tenellin synthetase [Clarias magur]|uniref:Tenellin synthetase n=1 Tax=Clarias magur TaxID=1594786 RepID=A0A8J4WWC5_CLAMG|nr:Tenellin synthetase [Clarias magur]
MKPWRGLWKALFTPALLASAPAQERARCYGHMEGLVCLSWLEVLTGLACGEEVPGLLVCTQHYQNRAWAGEAVRGRDQSIRPVAKGTGFRREKALMQPRMF